MKVTKFMAMLLAAVVCLGAFTACNDDDDDETATNTSVTSLTWSLKVVTNETCCDMFDYEVTVTTPDGKSNAIAGVGLSEGTSAKGSVSASEVSYPAEFKLTVKRTKKDDYVVAADSMGSISESFQMSVSGVDANGGVKFVNTNGLSQDLSGKLATIAESYAKTETCTITVKKTADGYTIE